MIPERRIFCALSHVILRVLCVVKQTTEAWSFMQKFKENEQKQIPNETEKIFAISAKKVSQVCFAFDPVAGENEKEIENDNGWYFKDFGLGWLLSTVKSV